jgi:NAD(P)-dependent dehydrogenase (short-subunit alcohol dehydrogenase family)
MVMQDKVVIVTGATQGIGVVTALELARMGAEVVLVSRSQQKLEDTVSRIQAETDNEKVSYIQADLSSMADVRQAAHMFLSKYKRLDVLVNNAGAVFNSRQESADGYEMTLALNHLNYYLLTNLLLDALKQTAAQYGEARVVNVSSGAHVAGKINFDDFQIQKNYSGWVAYSNSKLMNVMFTYELARRLEGTGVTANVLHPGFVNTGFGANNTGWFARVMSIVQGIAGKSPQEGAATNIYLAAAPEVKGITGKYWEKKKPLKSNKASYDVDVQNRLWEVSAQLTGLTAAITA